MDDVPMGSRMSAKRVLIALAGTVVSTGVIGGTLWICAGRWDLPFVWAYLAVFALMCLSGLLFLDEGLIRERIRPGGKGKDGELIPIAKVLFTAHLVIAGIDIGRFHFSDGAPDALKIVGLAVFAIFGAATVWIMCVNRFFSAIVRIQSDRGHQLVSGGPYTLVRHPGYVVISILILSSGVALGSWWSIAPNAAFVLLILRRTRLEDRYLHEHLEGYREYAERVRYRLIPGLW